MSATTQTLLAPISAENPTGTDCRYDPIYDEIREARREEDSTLSQGIWQRDLKSADWSRVLTLTEEALTHRTKDLQIAAWRTEALLMKHGLDGLLDGMGLIEALVDQFWDDLFPMEEDDPDVRLSPLYWLENHIPTALIYLKIATNAAGRDFTYTDWIAAQHDDKLVRQSPAYQVALEAEISQGKPTLDQIREALIRGDINFYIKMLEQIAATIEIFRRISTKIKSRNPDSEVSFLGPTRILDQIHEIAESILKANQKKQAMLQNLSTPGTNVAPQVEDQTSSSLDELAPELLLDTPFDTTKPSQENPLLMLKEAHRLLTVQDPNAPLTHLLATCLRHEHITFPEFLDSIEKQGLSVMSTLKFLGISKG